MFTTPSMHAYVCCCNGAYGEETRRKVKELGAGYYGQSGPTLPPNQCTRWDVCGIFLICSPYLYIYSPPFFLSLNISDCSHLALASWCATCYRTKSPQCTMDTGLGNVPHTAWSPVSRCSSPEGYFTRSLFYPNLFPGLILIVNILVPTLLSLVHLNFLCHSWPPGVLLSPCSLRN